jgi:LacI family transcriptional regulator
VEGDNLAIGAIAAQHFLSRGYRNFAWFPFTNDQINDERRDGFSEAIAKAGFRSANLPPLHELKNYQWRGNWPKNLTKIATALTALPKPVAIFCYNDCAAANVLHVCQDLGIPVPEQVSIVGVDNDELLCEAVTVPLTSVNHDLEMLGYQGATLLERIMDGEKVSLDQPRISPQGITLRQSSDMLAVNNYEVARALRYIWANYTNPGLQVREVVANTRLSRRPLEIVFKREVGRTINQEILRYRLEQIKTLLSHTRRSVSEIAGMCGFTRSNHLHRVFREHTGVSPKEFQKNQGLPT